MVQKIAASLNPTVVNSRQTRDASPVAHAHGTPLPPAGRLQRHCVARATSANYLAVPFRPALIALTPSSATQPKPAPQTVGARLVNCGAGGVIWWENMARLRVDDMESQRSWVMVNSASLRRTLAEVPRQFTMGDNASWGCGPNSSARAAMLLNNPIIDWNSFVEHCPRTFALPFGVSTPWPKVGPAPQPLADYLDNRSELQGFWVRAAHESGWDEMMEHLRYHLQHGRPVIILLSLEAALQHYVCAVGLDESRQRVAVLNTDGILREATVTDLCARMDAAGTWGYVGGQFSRYNAIRFDLNEERREPRWSSINKINPHPLLQPPRPPMADPNRHPFDCNPPDHNERCAIC
jgi:hypothetical protein